MNNRCPNCGAPFDAGTARCEYCGAPHASSVRTVQFAPVIQPPQPPVRRQPPPQQNSYPPSTPGKSRITAAILALFLGCFGVHKFYLGKTIQGILMLVFCWTFIPSFIAFIEFILLLSSTDQAFMQKYNRHRK